MEMIKRSIINFLLDTKTIRKEDTDIFDFCIESILEKALFVCIIIIFGCTTNNTIITVVFLAYFYALRSHAGGFHMRTAGGCLFVSIMSYIMTVLGANNIQVINDIYLIIVMAVSSIVICCLSPVQTENNSLSREEEKVNRRKVRHTILCANILYLISTYCGNSLDILLTVNICVLISQLIGIYINTERI